MPATWRDSSAAREATAADAPWWRVYRDTTLRRLVRTALARNTDLAIGLERVTEARARLAQARAARLPTLALGADAQRHYTHVSQAADAQSAGQSYGLTTDYYSARAMAGWELDIFGVQRNLARSAAAALQAGEETRRAVELLIVAGVATAYTDLQASDRALEVLQHAVDARRGYVAAAGRRLAASPSAELDLRQAQALHGAAQEAAVDLREAAAAEENALSVLLGQAPGPMPRSGVPGDAVTVGIPAGVPANLLTRRPDVRAAERELAGSGADVGAARAQLLPSLSLSADLTWSKRPASAYNLQGLVFEIPTSTTTGWSAAVSVYQPLFQGGQLVARLQAAESQRRQALIGYEATVLRALQETEDQLAAVRFAGERIALADSQVVAGRAVLALAERRWQDGTSPFLEVVDAQRTLLAAELGAVAARVRQADAAIGLYKALGGGWWPDSSAAGGAPL